MTDQMQQNSKSSNLDYNSIVLVSSCIFHNFTSVCRAGINATVAIQKSVVKENKGNAFHCVNPKAVMIDRCNVHSSKKCGILIEWLRSSDQLDVGRTIYILGNEIRNAGEDGGIAIHSFL